MRDSKRRDDRRTCQRLLREGSKSFYAASLLLPPRVRGDAGAVYAWCRVSDHAVDRTERPVEDLESVRVGLERTYVGRPEGPVERAFGDAVFRNRISRDIPEAMLEGFEWDVSGRRYETRADVIDYCVRVGSTVGAMMTIVMDRRDPDTLVAACRLGVAMQLTNIARDVGEDARTGRLYLPVDLLLDAGVDPESWLASPSPTSPGAVSAGHPGCRTRVRRDRPEDTGGEIRHRDKPRLDRKSRQGPPSGPISGSPPRGVDALGTVRRRRELRGPGGPPRSVPGRCGDRKLNTVRAAGYDSAI
jgi:hypothetical protein